MTQSSHHANSSNSKQVRTIGILAYEGMETLDLAGPLDVFSLTNLGMRQLAVVDQDIYPFKILAKQPGPVAAYNGLKVYADCAYQDIHNELDTLIIPGAPDVNCLLADPLLKDWLISIAPKVRRLVSVCTGAFLLAESNLLNGRTATTHWAYCNRFKVDYPLVEVEADRIFIQDDFIWTSGGITSGIDLALALIEEDWGREISLSTAQYLVMFLKRPGGQTQFSAHLVNENTKHPGLRTLLMWIMQHPDEDLRVETLAQRMTMSPRNFARLFHSETGLTPAKYIEKVRIDAARQYLSEANVRIDTAALKSGFSDSERMRKAFIRNLGITPSEYRARFGPSDQQPLPTVAERFNTELQQKLSDF